MPGAGQSAHTAAATWCGVGVGGGGGEATEDAATNEDALDETALAAS